MEGSRAEPNFLGSRRFGVRVPFLDLIHRTTSVICYVVSAPSNFLYPDVLRSYVTCLNVAPFYSRKTSNDRGVCCSGGGRRNDGASREGRFRPAFTRQACVNSNGGPASIRVEELLNTWEKASGTPGGKENGLGTYQPP